MALIHSIFTRLEKDRAKCNFCGKEYGIRLGSSKTLNTHIKLYPTEMQTYNDVKKTSYHTHKRKCSFDSDSLIQPKLARFQEIVEKYDSSHAVQIAFDKVVVNFVAEPFSSFSSHQVTLFVR